MATPTTRASLRVSVSRRRGLPAVAGQTSQQLGRVYVITPSHALPSIEEVGDIAFYYGIRKQIFWRFWLRIKVDSK